MIPSPLISACLIIALCLSGSCSAWQDCTSDDVPTLQISTRLMDCKVTGPHFLITPKKPSGALFSSTSLGIRVISVDQIQTVEGQPWNLVKRMEFADSNCITSVQPSVSVSTQVEEGADVVITPPDAIRDQIFLSIVGLGEFSNTYFNASVSASPISYNLTYPNITNTQGIPLQYVYPANTIKMSFSLENWPWDTTERDTHLQVNFLAELKLDSTFFLDYFETDFHSELNLDAEQSKILLFLERGAVIDGTPFRDDRGSSEPIQYYPNMTNTIWTFPVDFRFRNFNNSISEDIFLHSTTGFYKTISYDPTFSAIFTGSELETPSADPKARNNRSTIIGASVGAVLGAIALVGVAIFVVVTVPSIKAAVFPYAKRTHSQVPTETPKIQSSPSSSSSWSAYKPS